MYAFKCVGRGVAPLLQLSSPLLHMAATAEGDTARAEVSLRNVAEKAHSFQLAPPPLDAANGTLKLSPLVGPIAPGASQRSARRAGCCAACSSS